MIKQMDMACIIILMVLAMRATGEKISNMATARRVGLTVQYMKANTLQVRSMVLVNISGMINHNMTENGLKIRLKGVELTAG